MRLFPLFALFSVASILPAIAQSGDCSGEVCPTVLYLSAVEIDPSEANWTVADGKIIEIDPSKAFEGTISWSALPRTITTEGFVLELSVEGSAVKDQMYAPGIYVSGPYTFEPEASQVYVYLNGNAGKETLSVEVRPWSDSLAAGSYTLDIGAAFGKAVHYVYRTEPPPD